MAIVSNEKSIGSPSMTALNGQVFIAWTGTNHNINIGVLDENPSVVNKTTLGETSDFAPGIATHDGKIWLCWVGRKNHRLNFMVSADGSNWEAKQTYDELYTSAPSLLDIGGHLFLGLIQSDGHIVLNKFFGTPN